MRIAISTDGEYVSAHFGRCPSFTIIEIEEDKITKREVADNPGHEPGAIPRFLNEKGVECIIAGGMGMRATEFFNEFGIQTIVGVDGKIDDAIEALLKGSLKGGESLCNPGAGKGYGVEKSECDHPEDESHEH